ncbi:GreA/GreB family elongation factor [Microlunatus sp. GCM10028923]|uniref:GreA/GreB family elongation factor n=1 Tax=Microlunatus sp. GCM10028923 TaxID=3273400 RepID=UPI003619CA0D
MTAEPVWMTPRTLQRLEDTVADLTRPGRTPDDAEQARILELRELIRRAETEAKPDDGLVEPGMIVTVRFDGEDEPTTFLVGSRELAALDASVDLDVYSPSSPLGLAIVGRYVGDTISYPAPNGTVKATVVAAAPFG